ncbi:MAG: nucleotide sugar epimerase [Candidatus Marinimicrobia bacterium]|nr:nucleotide sugar epimerase [Candidatus Neomarinimicrobiota bacterium]RPG13260.1 MAG: NAD-dependent epimerase/dehydratase family protein [Pelagibacteraceae bacterium TMED232]|tara:strand:- start:528 stop:1460 length:933 start_codon:yes stop_codon:yes gene_type:complete
MKVFITGGLGQIGSHIAELFLERGDKVHVIDNLATGRIEHLQEHKNLQITIDTIANKKLVDELFKSFQPNIVIHTAASYKDPNDWYNDTLTNCVGGSNIISASIRHNINRFIYFQTSLCYGLKPIEQPITLNHPILPATTSYSITKTSNENFLQISGLDYVTFRLANVIGPRNVAGPLPIFYQRLKDRKKCFITKSRRDFVFVKDLAKVVIKACEGYGSGTYHFSSGKDVSIKELYDEVVNSMNFEVYPEPEIREIGNDDVFSILLDPSKTFEDFGEIKFSSLEDTVSSAINYFYEYGTLGEYTHLKLKK